MDKKSVYGIRKSKAAAEKQPKAYQSRSYNQQFEGYTYRTTLDSKGRKKLERVYDGVYYQAAGSAKMGLLRKIGYVLLYALSLGMLVGYGKSTFRSPWATALVIPEMATLFCYSCAIFLTLAMALVCMIFGIHSQFTHWESNFLRGMIPW